MRASHMLVTYFQPMSKQEKEECIVGNELALTTEAGLLHDNARQIGGAMEKRSSETRLRGQHHGVNCCAI